MNVPPSPPPPLPHIRSHSHTGGGLVAGDSFATLGVALPVVKLELLITESALFGASY